MLEQFLKDFARLEGYKLLVHGGGKIATQISKSLGIETQMIDGRRVTDSETLKVVTMVYAGLINKKVVARLQSLECNAIGLTGADANMIQSHKRPEKKGIDYGFVGDIDAVNDHHLKEIILTELTPVFPALTHDGKGHMLNTNADTIASALAVALSGHFQVDLIYCFELPGVMRDIKDSTSVISSIDKDKYQALKADGTIVAGMIPKMDNSFDAIQKGVKKVIICQSDDLLSIINLQEPKGTVLS